jgi:hypothetical protein
MKLSAMTAAFYRADFIERALMSHPKRGKERKGNERLSLLS